MGRKDAGIMNNDELRMDDYRDPDPVEEPPEPSDEASMVFMNWYFKKMAALEDEQHRVEVQYIKTLTEIGNSVQAMYSMHGETFERLSLKFMYKHGKKHINLTHGTVYIRNYGPAVRVTNAAAALLWAKIHRPDMVSAKEYVNFTEYNKAAKTTLDATGEALPGITIQDAKTVIYYPGKPMKINTEGLGIDENKGDASPAQEERSPSDIS